MEVFCMVRDHITGLFSYFFFLRKTLITFTSFFCDLSLVLVIVNQSFIQGKSNIFFRFEYFLKKLQSLFLKVIFEQFSSQYTKTEHSKSQSKKYESEHTEKEYLKSILKKYKSEYKKNKIQKL